MRALVNRPAASGRHTIEIRVKGTSGRPAVAIDEFLVLH